MKPGWSHLVASTLGVGRRTSGTGLVCLIAIAVLMACDNGTQQTASILEPVATPTTEPTATPTPVVTAKPTPVLTPSPTPAPTAGPAMATTGKIVGYWSDETADVAVTVLLREQGDVQNIAVTCRRNGAVVSGCPETVTIALPDESGVTETTFTIRVPMSTNPLTVSLVTSDGLSDDVEVDVPERILRVDRHVWECYSGDPDHMTRCGGWLGRPGSDAVYKWEPGKPIGVWATGRQDYLAALDGILKQISELMNHTFVTAGSREEADLVVGLGNS